MILSRAIAVAAIIVCATLANNPEIWAQSTSTTISVLDYGADPTGRSDSTSSFNAWWNACNTETSSKALCSIPSGTYAFSSDLKFDFSGNTPGGVVVQGAGENKTLLQFAQGKHLLIINSSTTLGGSTFYGTFSNFGVLANFSAGPALQLGQTNFSDALNGFAFRDIWVRNAANVSGSQGIELNEVYSSAFSNITAGDGCTDVYGNCPTSGDALLLTQSSFNTFQGSFSQARNGVRLAQGYNFGNVFTSLDLEVDEYDVVIDNAQSTHNTFIGGQFAYVGNAVYASAGSGNIVEHANMVGSTGSAGPVVGSAVGLTIKGVYSLVSTPAFPSSGTVTQNTTGRDLLINLYNLTSPTVCYGPGAATCITPGSSATVLVRNGDSVKITTPMGGGGWVSTELY